MACSKMTTHNRIVKTTTPHYAECHYVELHSYKSHGALSKCANPVVDYQAYPPGLLGL
jgi:hypothetical protein